MKLIGKLMNAVVAFAAVIGLAFSMTGALSVNAEELSLSAKAYVPEKADAIDYYGGVGDMDGGGFTTFAHAGLVVPLQANNIEMTTQFKLLSKKSVEEGGDGIDGWVTYSFSATPAIATTDKSYPYYGGNVAGYFLHITNYSGTTATNCVEVQFVCKDAEGSDSTVTSFWLDNAVDTKIILSLAKQEGGTYTLSFTRCSDSAELKKVENLSLNESLFANEKGQTFFSTAIYEADGCDGNHWEHRGVAIFSMQAYTYDADTAVIALSQNSYEFEEGSQYKPEVTVTLGESNLVADTDYFVTYADNKAIGTAKVVVSFINDYAGNADMEKTFDITEKAQTSDSGNSDESGNLFSESGNDSTESGSVSTGSGCSGAVGFSSIILFAIAGGLTLLKFKR